MVFSPKGSLPGR